MMIFPLHENQRVSAVWAVDQHVSKIPTEAVQALCCALYHVGRPHPYKVPKSRYNHPVGKWVYRSRENYEWTWKYAYHMSVEYWYRYGREKNHVLKSFGVLMYHVPKTLVELPSLGLTRFYVPDEFRREDGNWHQEVMDYYQHKLDNQPTLRPSWRKRPTPLWYVPKEGLVMEVGDESLSIVRRVERRGSSTARRAGNSSRV